MPDIAKRFAENPILKPADPSEHGGMKVECSLTPAASFQQQTWASLARCRAPRVEAGQDVVPHPSAKG